MILNSELMLLLLMAARQAAIMAVLGLPTGKRRFEDWVREDIVFQ